MMDSAMIFIIQKKPLVEVLHCMFIIIADEIRDAFIQFGNLTVDWPHKAQSKAYFPPKGIQ